MTTSPLCPFCGSYSTLSCELRDEMGGVCAWEESQPDPDELRDDRDERQRLDDAKRYIPDDF